MDLQFHELPYKRPDLAVLKQEFTKLVSSFSRAESAAGQDEILHEINRLRNEYESMATLAHIRHTLDTKDPFYKAEQDYLDEAGPLYEELVNDYYRTLTVSRFREELSASWGSQLFSIAEMTLKTFSSAVIEDLQLENKLGSRYKQLLASASIPFDGAERNLSQLIPYQESADRAVRKDAHEARYKFFSENQNAFDEIYDKLINVRTGIARKLGFKTYTEVGYLRMHRSDYDAGMVAAFRKQIEEYVVPLTLRLRDRQRQRLSLDNLLYFDEKIFYPNGNADPQGSPEEIVAAGHRMYKELSPETGEFFREMTERSLLDLLSRKGKAAGGYCTYMPAFKAPFIFANFNGTSGDIDVLTHEAGHAFQVWLCRDMNVPEYSFATMEAAEIPSMGMELLAWPWMERFFADKADKYRYFHLSDALLFLPYGALVDEFQHHVYEHPGLTPAERRYAWRAIEQKYLPHRDYAGHEFLEAGGFWFQQGHIFEAPFYYIDYVLAQTCVLQLWQRANYDRQSAWADYLSLSRAGGSLPFRALLEKANLASPFEAGSLKSVAAAAGEWLDRVNDKELI